MITLIPNRSVVVLSPPNQKPVILEPMRGLRGEEGPEGPPGPAAAAQRFMHTQSSAEAVWLLNHNLGTFPAVSVYSPGGIEIEAAIQHLSINQTEIRFNVATSGYAVCQ